MLFDKPESAVHLLPEQVRIEHVARRTRKAALSFLTGAAYGWTRAKLRSWLIVEYGMATEWTRADRSPLWQHPVTRTREDEVGMLVEDVRRTVTRMVIEASSAWSAPTCGAELTERGLLTVVWETSGREAYAPLGRADMTLVEIVGSLVAADYLASPGDYDRVQHCAACGEIPLGGRIKHGRACGRPPADSGIELTARVSMRPSAWPPLKIAR
ncbi:MAG TPA: hypothetical protein VIF62_15160 [Labilithrix sp.]